MSELLNRYREILNEMKSFEMNRDKRDSLQNEYNKLMIEYEKNKEYTSSATFLKAGIPLFISGILILMGILMFVSKDTRLLSPYCFTLGMFFYGLFGVIQIKCTVNGDRQKGNQLNEQLRINSIEPLLAEMKIYNDRMIQSNKKIQNSFNEYDIPKDYQSKDALCFFVKAIENRRAESEKEVFNLYELELNNRRLEQKQNEIFAEMDKSFIHCPSCNGTNCNTVLETETHSSPFGFGDACCGYILLGPIGLLCGLCGASSETHTDTYYKCNDCGKKFKL